MTERQKLAEATVSQSMEPKILNAKPSATNREEVKQHNKEMD